MGISLLPFSFSPHFSLYSFACLALFTNTSDFVSTNFCFPAFISSFPFSFNFSVTPYSYVSTFPLLTYLFCPTFHQSLLITFLSFLLLQLLFRVFMVNYWFYYILAQDSAYGKWTEPFKCFLWGRRQNPKSEPLESNIQHHHRVEYKPGRQIQPLRTTYYHC